MAERKSSLLALLAFLFCSCTQTLAPERDKTNDENQSAKPSNTVLMHWPDHVTELRLGLTPYVKVGEMQKAFEPVIQHLGKNLGVESSLVVAKDYNDLGRLLKNQEVDLAQLTPLAYVEAKEKDPRLRLILRQVAGGSAFYSGYIYTTHNTGIKSIQDLAKRSFCYVDPQSTSGYMYPRALLRSTGIDPDHFFGKTVFGKDHMSCLERVTSGELDAGATYDGAISIGRMRGLPIHNIRILAKTPLIPQNAFAVRSGLPEIAVIRIKQELLRLSSRSPGGLRILHGHDLKLTAWIEAEDSDYDQVRHHLSISRGL